MKVPTPEKMTSGNWYIRLRLGGESISVVASSKKDCIRQAEKIKADYRAEGKLAKKKQEQELTLRECIEKYMALKKDNWSPSTYRSANTVLNNRMKDYMDLPLSKIDWQEAYDKDAAQLSSKTMANEWGLIRPAVKKIGKITLPDIEQVKLERKERNFLELSEIKAFTKALKGTDIEIPALLCLFSLRMSELSALDWQSINFEANNIHISGAVVPGVDGWVEKAENKTESSTRYVPIFSTQLKDALLAVEKKEGKVFTSSQTTFRNKLRTFCKEHGFKDVSPHELRHSFATMCYYVKDSNGQPMPIKHVMKFGGWKNYQTVEKIYTHLDSIELSKSITPITTFLDGD